MSTLKTLKAISIEVGNENISMEERIEKNISLLSNDEILSIIQDAIQNGFKGDILLRCYTDSLTTRENIAKIIETSSYSNCFMEIRSSLNDENSISNSSNDIYQNEEINTFGCRRLFDIELPIDCYGNVKLCRNDWMNSCDIGNVKKERLSYILRSDNFLKIKKAIHRINLDLDNCPSICKKCDKPYKTADEIIYDDEILPPVKNELSSVVVSRAKHPRLLIKLLKSLTEVSDEVVLILDNCNQKIIKKLSKFVTTVVSLPGKGSYEAYAFDVIKYCTKDWIFRVDDDENISPNITKELMEQYISDRTISSYLIFVRGYINRREYIVTPYWYPCRQLRLFRNIPGILKLPSRVHERLGVAGEQADMYGVHLKHWDMAMHSHNDLINKVEYYESLCPEHSGWRSYLYFLQIYDTQTDKIPKKHYAQNFIECNMLKSMKTKENHYSYVEVFLYISDIDIKCLINKQENIFLSYHWYNKDMTIYRWDNARASIRKIIGEKDKYYSNLPIVPPEDEGEYFIRLDIVNEGRQWYSESKLVEAKTYPIKVNKAIIDDENVQLLNKYEQREIIALAEKKNKEKAINNEITKIQYDECDLVSTNSELSSVIISKGNDKTRLINLLVSLNKISDEVILILDNNNPNLVEELTKYATNVTQIYGRDCYEAYSKDILRFCTKDWILNIKDDEILSSNITKSFLKNYISNKSVASYILPVRWYLNDCEYLCNEPWGSDCQVRLFRNLPSIIELPRYIHEPITVLGNSCIINDAYIKNMNFYLISREEREKIAYVSKSMNPLFNGDKFILYEDYKYQTIGE
ncbi:MAG: SPASM domain-containing protein [Oscillospiraceae bacterium]|nr:SPASM domain-containing protein [Oscillospiraceae bacterium]